MTSFWAHCVQNAFCTDIGPSNSSKLQEMSELDQNYDLELLQANYYCGEGYKQIPNTVRPRQTPPETVRRKAGGKVRAA